MLGDTISDALELVGVTPLRVSKWLGKPCNCPERKEKFNQVHAWAIRVVRGKTERAVEFLNNILSE